MKRTNRLALALLAASIATAPVHLPDALQGFGTVAQAAEIKVVVNNDVITSYDIARRAAFLRLQRRGGNVNAVAAEELTDEALKKQEMARRGIRIPDAQVDAAFNNFASSNKMSVKQLSDILNQAGVTPKHFKEYIRVQIGWGQLVGSRMRSQSVLSEQDIVAKMLEKGGEKPRATEYMLQQVIFVVPAAKRGAIIGQRQKEAENMRARFNGCDTTRQFAKGLRDVTVRDLGRVLEPELPPDWAPLVKGLAPGKASKVRVTDRGVEFIGVCSAREVSNDRVAQLTFGQQAGNEQGEELSKKYLAELREKAKIRRR